MGPGRLVDTRRYFVVCSAVLGGSGGTTGPSSIDPATGQPFGPDFPVVTVGDMVRAQQVLARHLGLARLALVTGPCFGGQQALEWAVRFPGQVERVAALAATPATTVHNTAIFGVMARLIQADPHFAGGRYGQGTFPDQGMAAAMLAGVPLWMSPSEMEARFARDPAGSLRYTRESEFPVEFYLDQVGRRKARSLDPNSLLAMIRALQYFDLGRAWGGLRAALKRVRAQVLLVSASQDWRYPPAEVEQLHRALLEAGAASRHEVIDHPLGHSAFVHAAPEACASISELLEAPPR